MVLMFDSSCLRQDTKKLKAIRSIGSGLSIEHSPVATFYSLHSLEVLSF